MMRGTEILDNWRNRINETLLDKENENPFPKPPIATNFYNNPPLFCYGRDQQINDITNEIIQSIKSFEPRLIQVLGKQGIGKSTLICWTTQKLSKDHLLPIVYLETSGQPEDFKMKSLYRQIISKIEKDPINEKLILHSIQRFIATFKDSGGILYENLYNKFSGEDIKNILSDSEFIKKKIVEISFSQKLIDLLNSNAMLLQNLIPIDLTFLVIFWKAHVQNPEYIPSKNAFKGNDAFKGFNIQTDGDASKYIDEFIELTRWCFKNETSLIIIFDHLEAGSSELKEQVYSNLFSLLLNLRQKKYLTIFLSGTMDAYNEISQVLQEDQNLQLDNWSKTIPLTSLGADIIISIINQYFANFWNKFNFRPPPDYSLYPFGSNSIKYLYENNGQDLRKTLRNLYELIETYRKEQKIKRVDTFFEAFKSFRKREDVTLSYIEQRELAKKLLDSKTQDKNRSTSVETALCKFFNVLKSHHDYDFLTDVKHEPPLGTSKKKPDVFLEFFGKQGLEYVKKVGIEVKIYRKGVEIDKKDIRKTYILLEEKAVDYIIWITNVPLDVRYRYKIAEELKSNLGRIAPLDEFEFSYVSFLAYFEQIFGVEPSVEQAEYILKKIDLSPFDIKENLIFLPKITEIPSLSKPKIPDLTSYIPSSTLQSPNTPIPPINIPEENAKPKTQKISIEIGLEQILKSINQYIELKSKEVTKIISAHTIKAVKEDLHLDGQDLKWDEDIWTHAIDISQKAGYKTTPKTITFK